VAVVEPRELVAVIEYSLVAESAVGVPEISPDTVSSERPAGRPGAEE
jgi:hypothetical protein